MNVSINYNNEKIKERLTKLLTTPKGTMPFARNYGVDYGAIDMPTEVARNSYSVALMEAVEDFEDEVTVDSVDFSSDEDFNQFANVALVDREKEESYDDEVEEGEEYEW